MSRKSGERVRLGLYRAGNLKCPICLTSFTEEEAKAGETVTLEHVPPKALGGSVLCLTCAPCNAGAGGSLDQAAATMNREMTRPGPGSAAQYLVSARKARNLLDSTRYIAALKWRRSPRCRYSCG